LVPLRKLAGESRQLSQAVHPSSDDGALAEHAASAETAASLIVAPPVATPQISVRVHSALLSGVAGYVDAAGFVSLVGLFPAHLTGELVGDVIAISSGHTGHGHGHLWAVPVFVGSVVLATVVARLFRQRGLQARAGLLALVTIALTLFSASDALAWLLHEGQLPFFVRGGFAVAAMGFQSALMRESLTKSAPTTVMTGNLTQVVIDLVDHVIGRVAHRLRSHDRPRSRPPVASALVIFALSAALGGCLTRALGSISVALPTALVAALMLQAWREDSAARASRGPAFISVGDYRCPQPWPDADKPCVPDARDWPIEPYSVDFASEPRIEIRPAISEAEASPSEETERPRKARSISGTQLVELKGRASPRE
jgi:uncharacterized membrane protein YoaK (UPF0700 family)